MKIKEIIIALSTIAVIALIYGLLNNNLIMIYGGFISIIVFSFILLGWEIYKVNNLKQEILDQEYEYFNKEVKLRNTITVLESELETSKRFCRLNEIQIEDLGNKVMNYITENSKLKKENEKLNELIIRGKFNDNIVIYEEVKTKPKTIRKSPRNKSKKNETDNK